MAWSLIVLAIGCSSSDSSDGAATNDPNAVGPVSPTPTAGAPAPTAAGSPAPSPGLPGDPAAPQAGAPANPTADPGLAPGGPGDPTAVPGEPMAGEVPFAFDECGLDTGWPGDEYCILPPPPDQGFQMHIGPDNYESPASRYILGPGQEDTSDFPAISGNTSDIYFYFRQFRMRPGAHHMIVTEGSGSFAGAGRRIGTANLSQDNPAGGIIAPENEGVGIPLDANSNLSVSLHSINVTDEPILRELWVNFWYRDPAVVTEPATQLFKTGSTSFAITPGSDTVLGPYSCNISGSGRMLWFYGHRHANNVRFSTWRVRGGQRELIYLGYEWEEPLLLDYTTLVDNPVPDPVAEIEGGWSGILDLQDGDQLEWECHVINETDQTLRFTNETYLGEMCIMDGEMVGVTCDGF